MLLDDDVVTDREAEPGAFSGRLRREERIEDLLFHLGRNAGAVVTDADFHTVAKVLWWRQSGSARSRRHLLVPCAWSLHRSCSR